MISLAHKMRRFVYDPTGTFRGWLNQLVRHKIHDSKRARDRVAADRGSGDSGIARALEQVPDLASQDEPFPDHEDELRLLLALGEKVQGRVQLSTWQVFQLCDIEGLPTREVADQLGMKLGAVHRAKRRVRTMLKEEGEKLLHELTRFYGTAPRSLPHFLARLAHDAVSSSGTTPAAARRPPE